MKMKTIDTDALSKITGGVRPGPNGEGCTGPHGPRPRPRPPGIGDAPGNGPRFGSE